MHRESEKKNVGITGKLLIQKGKILILQLWKYWYQWVNSCYHTGQVLIILGKVQISPGWNIDISMGIIQISLEPIGVKDWY
jgi:hypothetical protein